MLDILINWNRWGNNPLSPGYQRMILDKICSFIDVPETITLIGMRRSGKSTVLYQIMSSLEKRGIPQKNMLYVNFEDPGFSNHLTPQLLDKIYRIYREEVCPEGKAYIFLDEIQIVPEWERWVHARNQTENIKIFITGSSSKLMSSEIATLLTGRHIPINIYPLNFSEYCQFRSIDMPNTPFPNQAPPKIQAALNQFLTWGGLPRVALAQTDLEKRTLLHAYLDDILFKDVAVRHQIRQLTLLKDLAVYLLTQTSCLISYKRLANIYDVSPDIIQTYTRYIEEAFLINTLSISSLKEAERQRNPKKIHVHDLGFRHIAHFSSSADKGKLVETAVFHALNQKENDGIFYWKKEQEIDFAIRQGVNYTHFIQAAYDVEANDTLKREINALTEVHAVYPNAEKILVVSQWMELSTHPPDYIKIVPLWKFLLSMKLDSENMS